jgi:hypothetical protein
MNYRLEMSQVISQRLLVLAAEGTRFGQGARMGPALRAIRQALTTNPVGFGERKYTLRSGAPVYSIGRGPLVMTYVVFESRQAVVVIKVERLLSRQEHSL